MTRKITFPAIKGTGVRRNSETGIEIRKSFLPRWTVRTFRADRTDMFESFSTLAEARTAATEQAHLLRKDIAAAYDQAHQEYVERLTAQLDPVKNVATTHPSLVVRTVYRNARAALHRATMPRTPGGMPRSLRQAAEQTSRLFDLLNADEPREVPGAMHLLKVGGRSWCGRYAANAALKRDKVTCPDCLAQSTPPTFTAKPVTDRDMLAGVVNALGDDVVEFDTKAIVDDLQKRYGTVDIDTIDPAAFWDIVSRHTC